MPIDLIPGVKFDTLKGSIYEYIENKLNLKIKSAHRKIRDVYKRQVYIYVFWKF